MLKKSYLRKKSLLYILTPVLVAAFLLLVPDVEVVYAEEDNETQDVDVEILKSSIKEKQAQIDAAENEKKRIQSQLTDVKNIVASLKNARKSLQDYVVALDSQLSQVQEEIDNLKNLISGKEAEIEEATADLEEAIAIQDFQYDSMKKRIKFIYEKGDNFFLDMIFGAGSFADMLNKADYAEKMSRYDSKMLEEYKTNCEYINTVKTELEADKELLDAAKEKVDEEEKNLQSLIDAKEGEINAVTADVNNKEAAAKEIEEDLAAQTAVITALEQAVAAEKARLAENSKVMTYDGGMFKWPAPAYVRISDDYGNRIHPILGTQQFHSGVDMAAPGGSPILAAYDGEVVASSYNGSMGNYIMINHGDGLYTIYMHASQLLVSTGQYVSKGDKIATVGTTGRSTGNHLHFGVRLNGSYVSPWNYLKG